MKFLILLFLLLFVGCNKGKKSEENYSDIPCSDSHAVTYLQPYKDFTQSEANSLCEKIEDGLNSVYAGDWTVKVLPNKPLQKTHIINHEIDI